MAGICASSSSSRPREPPVLRLLGIGCCTWTGTAWRKNRCAPICSRYRQSGATVELPGSRKRLFPPGYEEQRTAAEIALSQAVTVLTGGPGTGKTHNVRAAAGAAGPARRDRTGAPPPRIALAAPTGKAAARLTEAVAAEVEKLDAVDATRLAGVQGDDTAPAARAPRPDTSVRFKHNRGNRLPHDVIVVDETSMVSLTMMARLLEAVRPDKQYCN